MRWFMTRRVERRATRMQEMMDRFNVDAAALARAEQGRAYEDARNRCLSCGTSDQCLRWLDGTAPGKDQPPNFCPNQRLFQKFQRNVS
jgi:hypothetical protein